MHTCMHVYKHINTYMYLRKYAYDYIYIYTCVYRLDGFERDAGVKCRSAGASAVVSQVLSSSRLPNM